MWKEIFADETDKELERIAEITNQFSCWSDVKSAVTDSRYILKSQLSNKQYPYRCFIYKDNDFELVTDFIFRKNLDMWEEIRYNIKWDMSNPSIDLDIALRKMGEIIKQFLTETGKKIFMKPFSFDEVDDLIKNWYSLNIITIYKNVGVKATVLNNGKYWELELI